MEEKIYEGVFGDKTKARLAKADDITLGTMLKTLNEGFWEGVAEGLKALLLYWGVCMLVGVAAYILGKHETKKTGKDN